MKHSKFVNLSHKYLVELFSKEDKQVGKSQEFKAYGRVGSGKPVPAAQTRTDLDDLNKKIQEILQFLDSNKEVFDQLDQLVTDYEQHKVLLNPTVHIAQTKDVKNKDIIYFKAKTFWPKPNGERKEVKVHLGRAENYGNDTTSAIAKREAVRKMKETLARRIREGNL
jgi:hypothetical protein